MSQYGIASEIRIGFQKHDGELLGQTWIEIKKRVVNESEEVMHT